ncbi:hypothetical protein VA599_17790 [Chromobacterium sp. TRC.1.1.SA]|uniref:Uncharacterized protein n=1 Tax=Chromobacterium indicum TaxID=3110228 RepID=A0ABV0CNJ5_9NEIS
MEAKLSIKIGGLGEVSHAAQFPGFDKIGRLDINGQTYKIEYHGEQASAQRDANLGVGSRLKEFIVSAGEDSSLFSHRASRLAQALPLKAELPKPGSGEPIRCALYGGTHIRGQMSEKLTQLQVAQDVKLETIDEYNSALGIAWPLTAESYFDALDRMENGTLAANIDPDKLEAFAKGYPGNAPENQKIQWQRDRLAGWTDFLRDHSGKLDIFSKQQGKSDSEIHAFLAKNTPPTYLEALKDPRTKEDGDGDFATFANRLGQLSALPRPEQGQFLQDRFTPFEQDIVEKALNTAFFRQTSKLGLEYFQSSGAKIAFAWQDFSGKEMADSELQRKPWKTGQTRSADFNEPITLSEMRHVARHAELDVTRFKLA